MTSRTELEPERLEVRLYVETPAGTGVVVNVVRKQGRVTTLLVSLDEDRAHGRDTDRDWRAFDPGQCKVIA